MIYSSYILIILLKSFWYLSYFLIYKKLDTLLYIKDNENKWKIAVFAISKLVFYDVIVVFLKNFFIFQKIFILYIFFSFFGHFATNPDVLFLLIEKVYKKIKPDAILWIDISSIHDLRLAYNPAELRGPIPDSTMYVASLSIRLLSRGEHLAL